MREEASEFLLVNGLVVGFFRGDPFHSKVFHDGIVQGQVSDPLADLDHAGDLVRLAFAHQVGDRSREDEDFQGGYAAFLINALE